LKTTRPKKRTAAPRKAKATARRTAPAKKASSKKAAKAVLGPLIPAITCTDTRREIVFLKAAFGAEQRMAMLWPGSNRIMHAQVAIGASVLMLTDSMPDGACSRSPAELGGTSSSFYLYVPDVDATFARAVKAGGKATCPPSDCFWGDRMGAIECPEGFQWSIATHVHDYTPAQMAAEQEKFFANMSADGGKR
jgi:PhnB protein